MAKEMALVDHAQLGMLGGAGQGCQRGPALHNRVFMAEHQVVSHPQRVIAQTIGETGNLHGAADIKLGIIGGAKETATGVGKNGDTKAKLNGGHGLALSLSR